MPEERIETKLATASREGLTEVRKWLKDLNLSAGEIIESVEKAFQQAEDSGKPIGRPWPYLDAVMQSLADKKTIPPADVLMPLPNSPEDYRWPNRMGMWAKSGYWSGMWGPKPGDRGCLVPVPLLEQHGVKPYSTEAGGATGAGKGK